MSNKEKIDRKKLMLKKTTLRTLTPAELGPVAGGTDVPTTSEGCTSALSLGFGGCSGSGTGTIH
jgi:hypothetical protein